MTDRMDIARRHPHLIRALRWAACLTTSEAVTAIQAHREGRNWASEAINHFGGVAACLRAAIDCRDIAAREMTLRRYQ